MPGLSKLQALETLRARIRNIEKRPPLIEVVQETEGQQGFGLLPGELHEVFVDTTRDSGAALGFALAASRGLLTAERPAIFVIQLVSDSQDKGVPYGVGIKSLGLSPDNIILCRPETPIELLWAVEEAVACRAVATVIADVGSKMKALDFTASRRLDLRTAADGSTVFLLRYGTDREATAARFRWHIEPAASGERAFDARAPGSTRWRVELEKGRLGSKRDPKNWTLDWTEDGFVLVEPQRRNPTLPAGAATLSGVEPAALGDRLSKAG